MIKWDKIFEQPGAREACTKLIAERLDQELLEHWLCSIANSSDDISSKRYQRRRASSLARKARNLANEIECVSQSPGIPFVGWATDIEKVVAIPKNLRAYAHFLETTLLFNVSGSVSRRRQEIAGLLEMVKTVTGRYHYEEIADLLNAVDSASNRGNDEPLWDVTNLKQRQYSARRRLRKALNSPPMGLLDPKFEEK